MFRWICEYYLVLKNVDLEIGKNCIYIYIYYLYIFFCKKNPFGAKISKHVQRAVGGTLGNFYVGNGKFLQV